MTCRYAGREVVMALISGLGAGRLWTGRYLVGGAGGRGGEKPDSSRSRHVSLHFAPRFGHPFFHRLGRCRLVQNLKQRRGHVYGKIQRYLGSTCWFAGPEAAASKTASSWTGADKEEDLIFPLGRPPPCTADRLGAAPTTCASVSPPLTSSALSRVDGPQARLRPASTAGRVVPKTSWYISTQPTTHPPFEINSATGDGRLRRVCLVW